MHIIIDGCDGCGKTTLVDRLVKEYKLDKVVMTREGWKDVQSYEQKCLLDNVVSDRSFISEYVYSNVYSRESKINPQVFVDLFKKYTSSQINPWLIIILNGSVDTIMERVNKRGTDEEIRIEVENKVERYESVGKRLQLMDNKHVLYLDTTYLSELGVFNKVKGFIDDYFKFDD